LRTYSAELKDSLVAKMLPPNNVRVPQLVRETGIPRDTLYGWRRQAVGRGAVAATPASPVGSWSSEAKFAAVVETASLNELELGEYCRHKGLFPEQIGVWRETCRQANAALPSKAERAERRSEREKVQHLTQELQRKDRALAEAATLLILQKKVRAIWEASEAAPSPKSSASR
jgi:transposase